MEMNRVSWIWEWTLLSLDLVNVDEYECLLGSRLNAGARMFVMVEEERVRMNEILYL